jgi:hypothetical protein
MYSSSEAAANRWAFSSVLRGYHRRLELRPEVPTTCAGVAQATGFSPLHD